MIETRVSLIERVRNRTDQEAWSEFYEIYQPLVIAYLRKQGVAAHDAVDIAQDVFTRLIPGMASFEYDAERGRFRTWLWRVTHNALSDWARRRATRSRVEQEWAEQNELEIGVDANSEWDELYHRRIVEVVLKRIKDSTQPSTWACFAGRILEGRPAKEIAAETGLTLNAVYVNASHVLARVRNECSVFEEPIKRS